MSSSLSPSVNRPLEQLKVAELRDELKKRRLSLKGVKKELYERLEEAIRKEGQSGTPHGEPGTLGEIQRVSPEGMCDNADSEGEGEEFNKVTDGVPCPDADTVQEIQGDAMALDSQDMAGSIKETSCPATELDPAPENMEPEKDWDHAISGNDGIASDVDGHEKSNLTDQAGSNTGICAQEYVDHQEGSSVNSVVPERQFEHSKIVQESFGEVKQEAECPVVEPDSLLGHLDKPSVQALDLAKGEVTDAPQDTEMLELPNSGNREIKTEEVGQVTSVDQLVISQLVPEPLPRSGAEDEKPSPVLALSGDLKAEPAESETPLESKPLTADNTEMEYTEESPETAKVYHEPQFNEATYEKSRHDSSRTQGTGEGEDSKPDSQGGLMTEHTKDTKEVDLKPVDADSDVRSGQKRKDDDREAKHQEPTKRQRRWNSGNNLVVEPSKPLTTGMVKEIMSPEKKGSPSAVVSSPKSTPKIMATSRPMPPAIKVDRFVNGENGRQRVVPPPNCPPTTSLKIERFIRPFTLKAVKDLLSDYGHFLDFWMDQIKTHCYVTYSSVDEAAAARNALYDKQWPPSFGNALIVEFVDPADVKMKCDGPPEKPLVIPVTTPRGMPSPSPSQPVAPAVPMHVPTGPLPPPPPLRERPALPPKKEPEPPVPTLEDLFKKTKAKPHIYYLPLTSDQVAAKLAARSKEQLTKNNASSVRA